MNTICKIIGKNQYSSITTKLFKRVQRTKSTTSTFESSNNEQALISQIYLHSNFPVRDVDLNRMVEMTKNPSVDTLIESARVLQEEVPIRIARRIVALEGLPSLMVSHPSIEKLKEKLIQTFSRLKASSPVVDQASEREYMILQQSVRDKHADMYNLMVEALIHSGNEENNTVTDIINQFYSSRIGLRMVIDHHNSIKRQLSSNSNEVHGIIDKSLNPCETIKDMIPDVIRGRRFFVLFFFFLSPLQLFSLSLSLYLTHSHTRSFFLTQVRSCCESNFGISPEIILNGSPLDFEFSYVRDHVERIMYAILLNASRATAQNHLNLGKQEIEIPQVNVFVAGDDEGCTIRVNDEGGRLVSWNNVDCLFKYSSTLSHSSTKNIDPLTASAKDFGARTLDNSYVIQDSAAVRGFGLPMSRIYARYFGGDLRVVPVASHGSDTYVYLNALV